MENKVAIKAEKQLMVGKLNNELKVIYNKAPEVQEDVLKLTKTICRVIDDWFTETDSWGAKNANPKLKDKLYENMVRRFNE